MASIFQRKEINGKPWYVQYYYRGRRYREKVGGSKEVAQMRLGEIIRKIETGKFSLYSDTPLTELLEHFNKSLQAERLSDETMRRRQSIIKRFVSYCGDVGIQRVNQVDYPLLEEYATKRIIEDGLAPNTSNQEMGFIKRIFRFAVKHRYIMENPARDIKMKKVPRKEPRYFTHEEIDLLLQNAGKYEAFFMVLLHTGLRSCDAGNLKWSDIDLDKGLIRVFQEKTDWGLTIPMNDTLRNYLLDYATDTPDLFPELNTDSKRLKVRTHTQKILRDAGYQWSGVGCHAFRHTFASHLVINGASIYDVQKLLGHKSITMTQVYAHLSENATRRAVDLIDFNPQSVTNAELKSVIDEQKKV